MAMIKGATRSVKSVRRTDRAATRKTGAKAPEPTPAAPQPLRRKTKTTATRKPAHPKKPGRSK